MNSNRDSTSGYPLSALLASRQSGAGRAELGMSRLRTALIGLAFYGTLPGVCWACRAAWVRPRGRWGRAGKVARAFRAAGLPCEALSGGGTGTYDIDSEVPDVTELQVGSYALMDAEYAAIGSLAAGDRFDAFAPALTLLSTVISANHPGWVTLDAGLKALYHHGAPPVVLRPSRPAMRYEWFGDEHGKLLIDGPGPRPTVGEVVELTVSHCDPTVNLFDRFFVTRGGAVVEEWPIDLRGCCR